MWYANQITFVTVLIQAIGLILVAGLMLPIARVVQGRYLYYWSAGWATLAVGHFCQYVYLTNGSRFLSLLIINHLVQYLFGFLLWAGCRNVAQGEKLRVMQFGAMVPLLVFAVVGPSLISKLDYLFPFHAVIIATLLTLAFLTVSRVTPRSTSGPSIGLWTIRLAILGLAFLFLHYAIVYSFHLFITDKSLPVYLDYRVLYEVLFEIVLAFGMVILGTDRMREELEAKNQLLAEAAKEQSLVARLDSLTGLNNRRAFEELLVNSMMQPSFGSMAVIDMNDLKRLNDDHGHAAGDGALKILARGLRVHFRASDPMFRIGGDEFTLIMQGGSADELHNRMASLEASLHRQRLPGIDRPYDLSIAWGVSDYSNSDELTAAFQKADQAMYVKKRSQKALAC